jgi:hypothetical protein
VTDAFELPVTLAAKVKDAPTRMFAVVGVTATATEGEGIGLGVGVGFGVGLGEGVEVLDPEEVLPQDERVKALNSSREVTRAGRIEGF